MANDSALNLRKIPAPPKDPCLFAASYGRRLYTRWSWHRLVGTCAVFTFGRNYIKPVAANLFVRRAQGDSPRLVYVIHELDSSDLAMQ